MWGVSLLDNPPVYNADPSRLVDYRNLSIFLNSSTAGYQFPMPGNDAQAVYQGFQFLSGEQGQAKWPFLYTSGMLEMILYTYSPPKFVCVGKRSMFSSSQKVLRCLLQTTNIRKNKLLPSPIRLWLQRTDGIVSLDIRCNVCLQVTTENMPTSFSRLASKHECQ